LARLKAIPDDSTMAAWRGTEPGWQGKHGYRPLLAETFTDIESFEGTCYKVSNWEPCCLTKG
jgi:hypothetical protein